MAASVPAKPNKAGGRDERFDVVRVRASSVDACAALQEQTANCKTRFSLEMRARAPQSQIAAAQALPRAARALPARAPRAPPTHQASKQWQWRESIPTP